MPRNFDGELPRESRLTIVIVALTAVLVCPGDMLERAYLSNMGNLPLASITFQGESITGSIARVRSRIAGDRRGDTSIDYLLWEHEGRWAVYDVVLDGVGLVSSYRSQFNSFLRTASFAQLLERLRSREAGLKPEQGP